MVRVSWLLLGLLACWATAESNKTEINLIFPREGTFAPMHSMPVVFAIQNPSVAKELHATIQYGVRPKGGGSNETVWSYSDELANVPANATTYFSSTSLGNMLNTTGSWEFFWNLYWLNCSQSNDPAYYDSKYPWVLGADGLNQDAVLDGFHLSSYLVTAKYLFFDTKEGGTAVNLTTLTSDNQCSEASGFVVPALVNTLDIPRDFPDHNSLPSTCAQLANSTSTSATKASPCRVSISPEAEASILADAECHNTLFPTSGCPDKTPGDDVAAGLDHGRAVWAAITLAFALAVGLVGC
ncbi:hypothetical protein AN0510.2 [Aspergillus nidulans FGSC A4]|jgi:hypothetical protein|uniref:DUF7136 domain-containing protein n=1 Tax=Emericella nidulans (strain FGSC A4 / ATCC 38163 / CBS 112.46 / NRRL 194 / M139) TaxID=227321 RepID=Q5BG20_EMENI|nr:hypothetical protein [Aspergillus nidulans FGSC A4]EAA66609.1 hypothetical protein AN0510.2 [Aspergillus nidulans FGSC A4]CBF89339.1 TPA: conserved hypothetical protein [Aspergillus nidulans FGSC A4]|eukprot:XP_658114.1 hypothetical protein AN0510.2 [Aspergillus nidulans FGSC A4]